MGKRLAVVHVHRDDDTMGLRTAVGQTMDGKQEIVFAAGRPVLHEAEVALLGGNDVEVEIEPWQVISARTLVHPRRDA